MMAIRESCPADTCPEWVRLNAKATRLRPPSEDMDKPDFEERWAAFCEANRLAIRHYYRGHEEKRVGRGEI